MHCSLNKSSTVLWKQSPYYLSPNDARPWKYFDIYMIFGIIHGVDSNFFLVKFLRLYSKLNNVLYKNVMTLEAN